VNYRELMSEALIEATRSPDPTTQNGALVVWDGEILTRACNEFPRLVAYSPERWERPLKYEMIEHAERNAIYAAARAGIATEDAVLVCPWAACSECARAIIQAGMSELVTLAPVDGDTHGRWGDSIRVAMGMLDEAAVRVTYLDGADFADIPPPLRNGVAWSPC
jgi:dCMP deaminase